ncbi:hypothetical protein D3C81_1383610 [compost metagenome]
MNIVSQHLALLGQLKRLVNMDIRAKQLHQCIDHVAMRLITGQQQADLDRIQRIQEKMRPDLGGQRPKLQQPFLLLLALHLMQQPVDIVQHLVERGGENGDLVFALHRNSDIPFPADIQLDAGTK